MRRELALCNLGHSANAFSSVRKSVAELGRHGRGIEIGGPERGLGLSESAMQFLRALP